MGFEKPSSIQEMALPYIIQRPKENLIAQAQSGSGKTVAFCLGLLEKVDTMQPQPQALILVPTRELAIQCLEKTLLPMAGAMVPPLRVMLALGGTTLARGQKIMDHVVIGTPGKMEDWMRRGALSTRAIRVFVLDEADQMLAMGSFPEDCQRIRKYISQPHQSLLFSATFTDEVVEFAKRIIPPPINEIRLKSDEELVLAEITQLWLDLRAAHHSARMERLQELYGMLEMGQSIVFCHTKRGCDEVAYTLQREGFMCSNLHGDLRGDERDDCMKAFRDGLSKVLITTNVLARGVDVPAVTLVVNYDMPYLGRSKDPDYESYLHRIGRTGRFGRKGVAINFVQDNDAYSVLEQIERHFSPSKQMIRRAPDDMEELTNLVGDILSSGRVA
ncbi:ATP-dependent RNA helicase [Tribonema minus]|uniref:RNA helicase n=1 Tax=Tribonema minus TaxID=303371 RepID=A0A835ZGD2_9STRA|nr:ATP-dependent RNA helicase [Tribonema minus]